MSVALQVSADLKHVLKEDAGLDSTCPRPHPSQASSFPRAARRRCL
jgi:hypothetical protein